MKNRHIVNELVSIVCALFVFALFYKITCYTPLAGDDWGYALNGMSGNPFALVLEFYQSWSGRMVSEFWGFVVAPHKQLWNLLNPLLFTLIFVYMVRIIHIRKSNLITGLVLLVLMLNVSNQLRMETYTWLMGTTYVIPMFLSLVILYLAEKVYVLKEKAGKEKAYCAVLCVLCLICGLTMENIAAVVVFAWILIGIYLFIAEKKVNKYVVLNCIFSLAGFMIMRSSPGSNSRLLRDNADWVKMSLLEKINNGKAAFFRYSFLDNKYIILLLGVLCCIFALQFLLKKVNGLSVTVLLMTGIVQAIAVVSVFSNILISRGLTQFSFMADEYSLFSTVFWIVYTLSLFVTLLVCIENQYTKEKAIFYLMLAGSSTVIMLFSPIFGARSSLYFVYFAIVLIGVLFNELQISNKLVLTALGCICVFLIYRKTNEYIWKYQKVNAVYQKRLSDIEYYKVNTDVKEVHITRMPPLTVHGADVEVGDDYHFEVFKEYYGLPMDDEIIFEWAESY